MNKLLFILFVLTSFSVYTQTPQNFYYKNQFHSAYQNGILESYARSHISTSHSHFDPHKAYSFLTKLYEEGGKRKTLHEAGKEALSLLKKSSKFSQEQINSLWDWYEKFINNHPELNIPSDIPVGITIVVSGVLMNLIPGGQLVGTGLITIGTGLISKGLAEWAQRVPVSP